MKLIGWLALVWLACVVGWVIAAGPPAAACAPEQPHSIMQAAAGAGWPAVRLPASDWQLWADWIWPPCWGRRRRPRRTAEEPLPRVQKQRQGGAAAASRGGAAPTAQPGAAAAGRSADVRPPSPAAADRPVLASSPSTGAAERGGVSLPSGPPMASSAGTCAPQHAESVTPTNGSVAAGADQNGLPAALSRLQQYRRSLYALFTARRDALFDLGDALASNTTARTPVELSLNPAFRRQYSSITDAVDNLFQASDAAQAAAERRTQEQQWLRLLATLVPTPDQRPFYLFGLDTTARPRPYAQTLADRTVVHQPTPIRGHKPITVGHQDSVLVNLPEKETAHTPPWVVPLVIRRVTSQEKGRLVGVEQLTALVSDATLPFGHALCVLVVDSLYSVAEFLAPLGQFRQLVTIARLSGKRTIYRAPAQRPNDAHTRGAKPHYGTAFKLKDATTWGPPDATAQTTSTTRRGRILTVKLQAWYDLRMRGKRGLPMYQSPFTLIRAQVVDAQGQAVFKRPLWLIVSGARRCDLTLLVVWESYRQRFDIEHFFRFGKQRLLLTAYQTPDGEHGENWSWLVVAAYAQLWLARSVAAALPRPWERYLPQPASRIVSPTRVQRDFARILRQIGTPAVAPQPRGKSPGRSRGTRLAPRVRHPVIVKSAQSRLATAQST